LRQRPWVIKLMTTSLLLVPVTALSLAYFSAEKNGMPINTAIALDLWVLSAASLVAAFGVWRVRPWGFAIFFLFVLGVLGGDILRIIKNPESLNFWDLFDVSLIAIGVIFILQKHVAAPYFNPKIRWWERPARHKILLSVKLLVSGEPVVGQILDVSKTGCFLDTAAALSAGDIVEMDLEFKEFKFETQAKVIRKSMNPRGVGLMFVDSTIENKREIRRIIKDLKRNISKTTQTSII